MAGKNHFEISNPNHCNIFQYDSPFKLNDTGILYIARKTPKESNVNNSGRSPVETNNTNHNPEGVEYVKNQQEHHKKTTFREEYIALLKEHGIEYDEKYLL